MKKTSVRLVYVTAKDEDEARRIGEALVNKRLVACVNILPGMQSIYAWEGKVERAREVVIIAKTTKARVKEVERLVKNLHSYSVPCFLVLPVELGSAEYLKWIETESTVKRGRRAASGR